MNFKYFKLSFKTKILTFRVPVPFIEWSLPKSTFSMKKFSRYKAQKGVAGIWDDELAFLKALKEVYAKAKLKPIAITPYPVHGLEDLTKTPRSWIPWVTLVGGTCGCLFGLWFTWWASAVNWPLIVGGKPFWSLPAFIPIIFELTILFAALGSLGALFRACGLPHIEPPIIDKDLSCHKFAIFVPEKDQPLDEVKKIFEQVKAPEIKETEF